MLRRHLWPAIAGFLVTVSQASIAPYFDAQCQHALKDYTYDGAIGNKPGFELGTGYPSFTDYSNLVFKDANDSSTAGAGEHSVFWRVDSIDSGCRIVLMLEFSEDHYGATSSDSVPGNVIINAKSQGCYYSSLPENAHIYMTFCCGTGDCSALSAGNAEIINGATPNSTINNRSLHSKPSSSNLLKKGKSDEIDPKQSRPIGSLISRALSFMRKTKRRNLSSRSTCDANDLDCFDKAWASCTIDAGPSFAVAGSQIDITATQDCTSATRDVCNFPGGNYITSSSSFTITQDISTTTKNGVDVSLQAGVEWVDEETTAAAKFSLARAISNSAGKPLDNSTTFLAVQNLTQIRGFIAFKTFTPSYTCVSPDVDCTGTGSPGTFTQLCWPNMLPSGVQEGDYNLVYTDF